MNSVRKPFRDALLRHAAGFRKPVLLLHGDTKPFCLDKTFGGATAPKLWRLNAIGDFTAVDATVVTVRLDDQKQPFGIAITAGPANPLPLMHG